MCTGTFKMHTAWSVLVHCAAFASATYTDPVVLDTRKSKTLKRIQPWQKD